MKKRKNLEELFLAFSTNTASKSDYKSYIEAIKNNYYFQTSYTALLKNYLKNNYVKTIRDQISNVCISEEDKQILQNFDEIFCPKYSPKELKEKLKG